MELSQRSLSASYSRYLLILSSILRLHAAAHVITPLAQLPSPTPRFGAVNPHNLYGDGSAFLAKRAFEDVGDCDGAGILICNTSFEYCFSGINDYLGCCSTGKSCAARTECIPYPELSTRSCDHNTGGCVVCTRPNAPACVRLQNLDGQFGMYCAAVGTTSTYSATRVEVPGISTAQFATPGDVTTTSSPTASDSASPSQGVGPSDEDELSKGALAGIIVGAVAAVLIGLFVFWQLCIKKRESFTPPAIIPLTTTAEPYTGPGELEAKPYSDHDGHNIAGILPSSSSSKRTSGTAWNPDSFAHTPHAYTVGAELDAVNTTITPRRPATTYSVSSLSGTSPALTQQRASTVSGVSPPIGYENRDAGNTPNISYSTSFPSMQSPAYLDGREIGAPSSQHELNAGFPVQQYMPYRPPQAPTDTSSVQPGPGLNQGSRSSAYITPENATGGNYEREEARLQQLEGR